MPPSGTARDVVDRARRAVSGGSRGRDATLAQKALQKAEKAAYSAATPKQQAEHAKHVEAALHALQKAHAATPDDPLVPQIASGLKRLSRFTLERRGEVLSERRPKDPVSARLFDSHSGAQFVLDRLGVAVTEEKALRKYHKHGARAPDDKGFARMTTSAREAFTPHVDAGPARDMLFPALDSDPKLAKHRDAGGTRRTFAQALVYWFDHPDADAAKAALSGLSDKHLEEYEQVRRQLSREGAAAVGMSEAEEAAIATYTVSDFQYINPGASGDASWFDGIAAGHNPVLHGAPKDAAARKKQQQAVLAHAQRKKAGDAKFDRWLGKRPTMKDGSKKYTGGAPLRRGQQPGTVPQSPLALAQESDRNITRQEAALHTAVASSGLAKLPPWKGRLYRGEGFRADRITKLVTGLDTIDGLEDYDKVRLATRRWSWPHLLSGSRARSTSEGFGAGGAQHGVLWELDVLDGRDVARHSLMSKEVEVILLPGAEVAIDSVEILKKKLTGFFELKVKAHQTKRAPAPR